MRDLRVSLTIALCAIFIAIISCVDNTGTSPDYYEYYDELFIDTILIDEPVFQSDSAIVAYRYPGGCNQPESIGYELFSDTLYFTVNYYFYFFGQPCVHGPGHDSVAVAFANLPTGNYYAVYRKSEMETIGIPFTCHRGR